MSTARPEASEAFEPRFDDFVAKFSSAASYGSPTAMQELRLSMRRLAERSRGPKFWSVYRRFADEVDHASGLKTELGRSKRLRDKADDYVYRLREAHVQDSTT